MSLIPPGGCIAQILMGAWAVDVSPDTIADVTISHGRQNFETGRAALSTSQYTIRAYEHTPTFWAVKVGEPVGVFTGPDRRQRHQGIVSDVTWEWAEDGRGRYVAHRITTTGTLARLGATVLPYTAAWASEPVRQRAQWVLSSSGKYNGDPFAYFVQAGDFNPALMAAERDATADALTVLEGLTWPGEAVLWDDTNGNAVWQELGWRRTTPIIDLPACAVRWAPQFRSQNDLANEAVIEWGAGDPRPTVQSGDGGSWFAYGRWAERWASEYADSTGAQTKATRVVRRQARPQVLMPSVTVLPNLLTATQWAAVAALRVGDRVRLPALPDPTPMGGPSQTGAVMVVEGWTERVGSRVDPDRDWEITLHLSPPIWSMVSRRWDETGGQWQQQTKTWDQIGAL